MRIALFGATGYGGMEALRYAAAHGQLEVAAVFSDTHAGKAVGDVLAPFRYAPFASLRFLPNMQANDLPNIDAVLMAMPHGEAHKYAPILLAQGIRVVDFSGDFRLPKKDYEAWYGRSGSEDLRGAVYGLPELFREEIRTATLVANPGCYATAAELALLPLVEAGLAAGTSFLIDAKSGVSGAGKTPQPTTHLVEVAENVQAYKVGAHQHTPEIERTLREARRRRMNAEGELTVLLTTQLLPIKRGIYVSAYAVLDRDKGLTTADLHEIYETRYEGEPFVRVLPVGQAPEIRYVNGTNECHLGVHVDPRTSSALVFAAIDNLGKGAAGQAIQNLNVMLGIRETEGLTGLPWW